MNTQLCWAVAGELGRLETLKSDDADVILIGDLLAVRCVYSGKATSNTNKQVLKCLSDNIHRVRAWVLGANDLAILSGERQVAHKMQFMALVDELKPVLAYDSGSLRVFPSMCVDCRNGEKTCHMCSEPVTTESAQQLLWHLRRMVAPHLPLQARSYHHCVRLGKHNIVLPYYVYPAYTPNMQCLSTIAVNMCKEQIDEDESVNMKDTILKALVKRFACPPRNFVEGGYSLQAPPRRVRLDNTGSDLDALASEYRRTTAAEIRRHLPNVSAALNEFISILA